MISQEAVAVRPEAMSGLWPGIRSATLISREVIGTPSSWPALRATEAAGPVPFQMVDPRRLLTISHSTGRPQWDSTEAMASLGILISSDID
ncbi:hypothetical protein ACH4D8_37590 [Streptomyces roseolus]|uniref:hypothetical protein n=1 Tax=Streptomyces roseolus TaxID=67358 RepID=UPI0037A3D802